MAEKKIIRLNTQKNSEQTAAQEQTLPKKRISLTKKNNTATQTAAPHKKPKITLKKNKKTAEKKPYPKKKGNTSSARKKAKPRGKNRNFIVRVCTSKKSCGENYGPYIWERVCNEHNQPHESEEFEVHGITYRKSPCQGYCKKKSNVQVENPTTSKKTQFHYMTPIKAAKLIHNISSGANPENIRRL